MPEDPLVARVRAAGITPNPETEFCRAWRRVLPVYTPAYDIACQGLWYLACGLMMVPTPIVFGGGEKRTDTRQSVALVAQTGAGKDAMINAVMKQLRAASPEVRIENMSVSHEEQLRGGSRKIQVEVKVETGTKAEKTPEGGGDKPPTRKRTLWLPQYGILGSDLGYMKEGLRLTTDPRYETHREYLRDALNPYGENWIGKRLSGVTFGKGLSYCSPVVIILGFQPGELPADFTSRGLGRRMLALMASLSSAALRRVTTRGDRKSVV